ncbi:MAG: HAD family hydrolase [Calditrichia bacterium]
MKNIKIIAFDADDTLWVNEPYFRETEARFCELVREYLPEEEAGRVLLQIEMANLPLYGYGIKAFTLSLIEALLKITNHTAGADLVQKILDLGKEMLNKEVEVLEGVPEVLAKLNGNYRLVLATKGDLLDQERKLKKSGLEKYFHHIEVMSDKKTTDYARLLKNLDCVPANFLMVGNSLKSDVLPVLELGGYAVHVPFHTTWVHEEVETKIESPRFLEAKRITDLLEFL